MHRVESYESWTQGIQGTELCLPNLISPILLKNLILRVGEPQEQMGYSVGLSVPSKLS